jgi:hypothetical protein
MAGLYGADGAAARHAEAQPCLTCGGYGVTCPCGEPDCVVSWYDPDHVPDPCPDCDGLNVHRLEGDAYHGIAGREEEAEAEPG